MSDLILESIPTAVVIIEPSGTIKYLNKSVGKILGSMETLGKNILEFDTVVRSGLDIKIQEAFNGMESEIFEVDYTSFTSRKKLILNARVRPFRYIEGIKKYEAMLLLDDITKESNLNLQVENQYLEMFKSFSKFIDAKDPYTGQHSNNVFNYVDSMLSFIGLSELEKHDIRIAAALHDIGKIGISEYILNKTEKLTDEEYEQMKKHPSIGAKLLEEIDSYKDIAVNIRHHHERWDGRGYPDKLEKEQIPVGSQMIAIADTYDAIISDRIYRKSRSKAEAVNLLKDERWKQFNGDLVDLFVYAVLESIENAS